ncbi:MAG TPA: alpha-amylase family protein [Streptosporangiaceae bacterium]|nr:alpha-amylase family protein [Streptosporangiaceae bacterium]
MADWPEHAIWWQLHPLTFTGAEAAAPEPAHRFGRIEAWLDYLVDLGCNGLLLGPIFASQTHGYDTIDHFRIDPRLGTDEDFDHLVAQCQARGVRLLLDGVFNHVGREFGAFRDVLAHGRSSAYAPWFRLDFDAAGPDGFGYADFEGHHELVALNHAEPAVQDYVARVMTHWLDRGASGWRLDAAYAVPLPFWRVVTDRVRAAHPGPWLVGELIHGDYQAAVHDGGLDSVTQYELWKAIWSSLNDENFFELAHALTRHNAYAAAFLPQTFVGNHDVTRLASRLTAPEHLPHALAVLFTVAGAPSVYAGDEQAFRGVKYDRAGGDDEIRPAFPDIPADLAPDGWPTYRLHQDLIGLRRRHPWLARAGSEVLTLRNEFLAYRVLHPGDGPDLAVLLNVSAEPATADLHGRPAQYLLGSDAAAPDAEAAAVSGTVPGHGWAILELAREAPQ